VNDIVNGRVPPGPVQDLLLRGRWVALKKPNDKPRPIGVGEAFLNLALSCLVRHMLSAIQNCLSNDDFGFGTRDGAAKAALKAGALLRAAEAAGESRVIIKIDFTNAYGTSRMAVLRLLLDKLPKFARAFVFTHGTSHKVHFDGAEPID